MASSSEVYVNGPTFLTENQVKELLSWPLIVEAVEQSLMSVSENTENINLPISSQPARSFTSLPNNNGSLLTMPGFIGNYELPSLHSSDELKHRKINTLACKLVTSFHNNHLLEKPIPNILGTIFLFDETNGKLKCIMEATEITAWRTAAASLVATKHLFFNRPLNVHQQENKILSIIGCGVQGRIHAIGMCSMFHFNEIRLWNRTARKATALSTELHENLLNYKNPQMRIIVSNTVEECVNNSDIIVTATFVSEPILQLQWLKPNCHINAIGAGLNHHSELSNEIYLNSKLYMDYWAGAQVELKALLGLIVGQVGDVINNIISQPTHGITVFQSMGMAIEDSVSAQMIYDKFKTTLNQ